MEWTDQGIVLAARPHGESGAVVTLLTRAHGRHAGLVRGGTGRRARGIFEPGNRLQATWRARLTEHLGHYDRYELLDSPAATLLDDPLRLAALAAATAVAETALPEREAHPRCFDGLEAFLELLRGAAPDLAWQTTYVRWELDLLAELGFGLDLAECAATGATTDLVFVSPKTGRAVSQAAAAPYRDRLLPLPPFLTADIPATPEDILAGLRLTGFFLDRDVFTHAPAAAAPAARDRLLARLRRG